MTKRFQTEGRVGNKKSWVECRLSNLRSSKRGIFLLVFLVCFLSAVALQAQPPISASGGGEADSFADMPEIPEIEEFDLDMPDGGAGGEIEVIQPEPQSQMPQLPQDVPMQQPQQGYQQQAEEAQEISTGPVVVEPGVSKEIGGAPVLDPRRDFMNHFAVEALFGSKHWNTFWFSPVMGLMRVTTLPQPINAPRGPVLKWKRDAFGNPMVYLRAQVNFPRLGKPDAISEEQPLGKVPVVISQAVVFYQRPGGWMASASPMYVTVEPPGGKKLMLVRLNRGQGVWRAWVGHGGVYVENFIGAGLMAARTELYQYFRDEEIRLFAQGNSDVIFYIRPRGGMAPVASK